MELREDKKDKTVINSEDAKLPECFNKKRHSYPASVNNAISKSWRIRDRMKTVSVALVVCLNVGVDPPDVFKISPCARLECWIDPSSYSPQKALEMIGINLQRQYERWQPRARYKQSLDPTVEDIKKLCSSLRRNAKEERVLFHYNGHGVPRPTVNGEIWVFNRTYTQYIPLSIYDLQSWMGAPSIYVYDCSNAGIIVNSFNQFAEQHEREMEVSSNRGSPNGSGNVGAINSQHSFKNCLQMAACTANQILPMNPQLPADLFTSCLTTPIKIALKWFTLQQHASLVPKLSANFIDRIPGQLNDRRTMLGELNWIFTAITDTIAWSTMPRELFQKLFRQDLLVASLFRNYLLADRIMRSYDCTPITCPELPSAHRHPMWAAWDICVDLALQQLPDMLENGCEYENLTFFEDQLTAFHVWLERGSKDRTPPLQLPIVLQVLLSQVHRIRALELLGRFLDLGPWAVHTALSVGIFPYVLKLLQASSKELRPLLVFIWAKILAVDSTCQVDLVCDKGHKYFLSVLQDTTIEHEYRTMAAFILALIVQNFPLGQANALQGSMVSICLVHLYDNDSMLRQYLAICLGNLWQNYDKARWSGVRDLAHEKLYPLLQDPVPEVRAAAVYALGTFISSVTNHKDRTEHANNIDRAIAMTLLSTVGNDMSPIVRMELVAALQWMVILFENFFVSVFLQEPTTGVGLPTISSHHTHSLERNTNIKRVSSSSSIVNMSGASSLNSYPTTTIGFGSIYMKLWRGLIALCKDPHPDVAIMATKEIDFIVNQAVDLISAKEATKENFNSSLSLPPSPNTRMSYLSESPPHHINQYNSQLNTSTMSDSKLFSSTNNGSGRLPTSRCSTPTIINASSRSRKNSKNLTINETTNGIVVDMDMKQSTPPTASSSAAAIAAAAAVLSPQPPPMPSQSQNADSCTTIENQKPIVTTTFLNWCVSQFSSAATQKISKFDCHAPEQLDREWRYQRNDELRKSARDQQLRAHTTRLETHGWSGRTQSTPKIIKLHPYEPQIVVAYRNKISVNDWIRGAIYCCAPQPIGAAKPSIHSILGYSAGAVNAKVSALEFPNAHDKTLILAGYEDGNIRIWRPPTSDLTKEYELVTAWQAIGDITKFQNISGLVTAWQQQSQTVVVAGATNYLRCWNVETELRHSDIRTGSDSSVVQLTTGTNELLAAGFTDGSVRLYDKRCPPFDARIMTYRESTTAIMSVCLMDDCQRLVTGCSQGKISLFDVRKNACLTSWSSDSGEATAIAIHSAADIVAIGSNSINVHSLDGRQLSTIRTHGYIPQRINTASCLSFHPLKVSLAIGYIDNTVAVYVTDVK